MLISVFTDQKFHIARLKEKNGQNETHWAQSTGVMGGSPLRILTFAIPLVNCFFFFCGEADRPWSTQRVVLLLAAVQKLSFLALRQKSRSQDAGGQKVVAKMPSSRQNVVNPKCSQSNWHSVI